MADLFRAGQLVYVPPQALQADDTSDVLASRTTILAGGRQEAGQFGAICTATGDPTSLQLRLFEQESSPAASPDGNRVTTISTKTGKMRPSTKVTPSSTQVLVPFEELEDKTAIKRIEISVLWGVTIENEAQAARLCASLASMNGQLHTLGVHPRFFLSYDFGSGVSDALRQEVDQLIDYLETKSAPFAGKFGKILREGDNSGTDDKHAKDKKQKRRGHIKSTLEHYRDLMEYVPSSSSSTSDKDLYGKRKMDASRSAENTGFGGGGRENILPGGGRDTEQKPTENANVPFDSWVFFHGGDEVLSGPLKLRFFLEPFKFAALQRLSYGYKTMSVSGSNLVVSPTATSASSTTASTSASPTPATQKQFDVPDIMRKISENSLQLLVRGGEDEESGREGGGVPTGPVAVVPGVGCHDFSIRGELCEVAVQADIVKEFFNTATPALLESRFGDVALYYFLRDYNRVVEGKMQNVVDASKLDARLVSEQYWMQLHTANAEPGQESEQWLTCFSPEFNAARRASMEQQKGVMDRMNGGVCVSGSGASSSFKPPARVGTSTSTPKMLKDISASSASEFDDEVLGRVEAYALGWQSMLPFLNPAQRKTLFATLRENLELLVCFFYGLQAQRGRQQQHGKLLRSGGNISSKKRGTKESQQAKLCDSKTKATKALAGQDYNGGRQGKAGTKQVVQEEEEVDEQTLKKRMLDHVIEKQKKEQLDGKKEWTTAADIIAANTGGDKGSQCQAQEAGPGAAGGNKTAKEGTSSGEGGGGGDPMDLYNCRSSRKGGANATKTTTNPAAITIVSTAITTTSTSSGRGPPPHPGPPPLPPGVEMPFPNAFASAQCKFQPGSRASRQTSTTTKGAQTNNSTKLEGVTVTTVAEMMKNLSGSGTKNGDISSCSATGAPPRKEQDEEKEQDIEEDEDDVVDFLDEEEDRLDPVSFADFDFSLFELATKTGGIDVGKSSAGEREESKKASTDETKAKDIKAKAGSSNIETKAGGALPTIQEVPSPAKSSNKVDSRSTSLTSCTTTNTTTKPKPQTLKKITCGNRGCPTPLDASQREEKIQDLVKMIAYQKNGMAKKMELDGVPPEDDDHDVDGEAGYEDGGVKTRKDVDVDNEEKKNYSSSTEAATSTSPTSTTCSSATAGPSPEDDEKQSSIDGGSSSSAEDESTESGTTGAPSESTSKKEKYNSRGAVSFADDVEEVLEYEVKDEQPERLLPLLDSDSMRGPVWSSSANSGNGQNDVDSPAPTSHSTPTGGPQFASKAAELRSAADKMLDNEKWEQIGTALGRIPIYREKKGTATDATMDLHEDDDHRGSPSSSPSHGNKGKCTEAETTKQVQRQDDTTSSSSLSRRVVIPPAGRNGTVADFEQGHELAETEFRQYLRAIQPDLVLRIATRFGIPVVKDADKRVAKHFAQEIRGLAESWMVQVPPVQTRI
ncbi:unnamed protein product [Amoebophrya sp. A25]|nr:unnamed protein product [Amoebophrya sp. A25]|eukprot:GSA25T00017669001.1